MFLLVTLQKGGSAESHHYRNRFLGSGVFEWQSQNQTRQADKRGQLIRDHVARGANVQLFVRMTGKIAGRAAPFIYCGNVTFIDWEGEKPITVRWQLSEAVPQHLRSTLGVPAEPRSES